MAGSARDRHPHGRTIRCAGGYRAFLPAPLPPPIGWNDTLAAALSRADLAVGRLAGEGSRFPNPHLFIRSFVRREAVLSSRIEGTRTTLAELLAAEAGAKDAADSADLREVANYVAALEYGIDRLDTLPLSLRLVREIHERLMRGVRGDSATPGEFRRSQNWIGPPGCSLNDASYVPRRPSHARPACGPTGRTSAPAIRKPHAGRNKAVLDLYGGQPLPFPPVRRTGPGPGPARLRRRKRHAEP